MSVKKTKPAYDLEKVQAVVRKEGANAFTKTAFDNGRAMDLTVPQMLKVIADLRASDFYHSLQSHQNADCWQDVYHAPTHSGIEAYIKLTLRASKPVIQFKRK
jgi:motility quorum-sensing regulator/GCU-specific mRNA interferase toxin